jgi:hypothetical protein
MEQFFKVSAPYSQYSPDTFEVYSILVTYCSYNLNFKQVNLDSPIYNIEFDRTFEESWQSFDITDAFTVYSTGTTSYANTVIPEGICKLSKV